MHAPQLSVSAKESYRADIDGLRAVAVVAVLLFHLGIAQFSGGFVGVDVFFVISGFLITGMIVREGFSLLHFYARRGRRLLPAMFAVIALCNAATFLLLAPDALASYAKSAVASVLLVANLLFWSEAGYWDTAARSKPLLHLWTLALEWQFYFVWPLVLMAARKRFVLVVAIAALVSLATALWVARSDPSAAFFLMPFRVFEFAIGALLWFAPPARRLSETACIGGLAMIALSVVAFAGHSSPALMLIPTIGAALAIWGGRSSVSGLALRNPVSAYVGRASYSIYLVHWPLIVLTEYFNFSPLNRDQAVILFFASIGFGALLHHLIEKPIHLRRALTFAPRYTGLLFTAAAAAIVAIPAAMAIPDGLSWRIDKDALQFSFHNSRVPQEIYGRLGCNDKPCMFGNSVGPKILVIGDSHVDHYTKTLNTMGGHKYAFYYAGAASCFNGATFTSKSPNYPAIQQACEYNRAQLVEWLSGVKFDGAIVAQRWVSYFGAIWRGDDKVAFRDWGDAVSQELADVHALLKPINGPVIFAGWAPTTNAACYVRPRYFTMKCPTQRFDDYTVFRSAAAKFLAMTPTARLVDVAAIICPDSQCQVGDKDGHILYTDSDHLSIYGAALVVPQMLSIIEGGSTN